MSSNKSFSLSSSPVRQEEEMAPKVMEKQGIVSILGSDSQLPKSSAPSLRRTLSADMSSKKWLAQNGFKSPALKKIASSAQLSIIDSSTSSDEEEIKMEQPQKQGDIWSSIMSQPKKTEELPPPYVHPLVKKANSALSEKSLEVCTESLGSETGSDGFSSKSSSETGSEIDEEETTQQDEKEYVQANFDTEEAELPVVAKYNYSPLTGKKVQPRAFPPPISSLTRSSEGPSLHMHSRRVNGRLVLEAVSVPSTKKFHAQREDGRLLLTLLNATKGQDDQVKTEQAQVDQKVEQEMEEMSEIFHEEEENEVDIDDDDDEEEEMDQAVEAQVKGQREMGIVMEQAVPKMTSGLINVHRSALMMKKLMGTENQNPKWSNKFNYTPAKLVESDAQESVETTQLPKSLPPRPRVTRHISGAPAASFNAYEYFWRSKPEAANQKNQLNPHSTPIRNNTTNKGVAFNKPEAYEQQGLVFLRNCKEAKRTLLSWEPYCIATS